MSPTLSLAGKMSARGSSVLVSHTRTVLSHDELKSRPRAGASSSARTLRVWPTSCAHSCRVERSHATIVPESVPANRRPCASSAASASTGELCTESVWCGFSASSPRMAGGGE